MMTKLFFNLPLLIATLIAAICIDTTDAAIVVSSDTPPSSYSVEGQVRNGRSGFEGILKTPGPDPNMNPTGAPVWKFGTNYTFELLWSVATGKATWSVDFNNDGDYLDSSESVSQITPALISNSFAYVNLFAQGNALSTVTVSSFNLNGTTFGSSIPFTTTTSGQGVSKNLLFENTSGLFGDISAVGTFSFSANGNNDERPRLWVQLGNPAAYSAPAPVPELSSICVWSAIGGLGAVVALKRTRSHSSKTSQK